MSSPSRSSAREQAREAALAASEDSSAPGYGRMIQDICADAASDVWEPLLRNLYQLCCEALPPDEIDRRIARAKEALDG